MVLCAKCHEKQTKLQLVYAKKGQRRLKNLKNEP